MSRFYQQNLKFSLMKWTFLSLSKHAKKNQQNQSYYLFTQCISVVSLTDFGEKKNYQFDFGEKSIN